jgi:hypothetical protein
VNWDVVKVEAEPGWDLSVRSADGLEGRVRFMPDHFVGTLAPLRQQSFFERVTLDHGAVAWPGDIDLAPDAMHEEIRAHGEWVLGTPLHDIVA